jgi:hypothetical protein
LTWKFRSLPQFGQLNFTYDSLDSILCNGRDPRNANMAGIC